MLFTKKCAQCGNEFMRMGCAPGNAGYIGRILGGLFCFVLFGGTSKYCPNCRKVVQAQKDQAENGAPQIKLDKSPIYRVVWFVVAIVVLLLIISAA